MRRIAAPRHATQHGDDQRRRGREDDEEAFFLARHVEEGGRDPSLSFARGVDSGDRWKFS